MKTLKENPVAAQSKQMLLSALLDLMEHKLYSSISIRESAECAGLAAVYFVCRNQGIFSDLRPAPAFFYVA